MNKTIYFMGIGGTAMGNVACMLKQSGYNVCGSDKKLYPPMSDVLKAQGINAIEGFSPDNLIKLKPDLVIVGNVITRGNLEFEWLLETKTFPFTSLAEFLGKEILNDRFNIVVSGTHGKTTTTTLVSHLLKSRKFDNGYMIGGVPVGYDTGCNFGNDKVFVIEGDEYDTALFDKRSKFVHYSPNVLIINNIEYDHADIFFNLDDVKRAFFNVAKIVPQTGYIVVNGDDQNSLDTIKTVNWTNIIKVGIGESNDFIIKNRIFNSNGSKFDLFDKKIGKNINVNLSLFGEYNCQNTALAIVAAGLFYKKESPLEILNEQYFKDFLGIKRRQEEKFHSEKVVVIDDFGHHPTAIKKTIDAIKEKFTDRKLIVCFEPRSNTTRTEALKLGFASCFDRADEVFFATVFQKENYTKFNELNLNELSESLRKKNINAHVFDSNINLFEKLKHVTKISTENIAILFFSNGSFDGIPAKIVDELKRH